MKKRLPNFITLINLFCGCCAIVSVLYNDFMVAFWFLLAGGIADYLDGMVARWLRVQSPVGKELDSMADMVSFGVMPGMILYMLLVATFEKDIVGGQFHNDFMIAALPAFFVSMAAGYRLAHFNLDERQTEDFIGLATPSCTIFVTGLMLIYEFDSFGLRDFVANPIFLYSVIIALSYLLNAEIRLFSFKFKGLKWAGNEIRFIFAAIAILLMLILREAAFSLIIFIYVLLAIIDNQFFYKKEKHY